MCAPVCKKECMSKKKKLVYIIQSLGVGGTEVALLSAVPTLCDFFDFHLIVLKKCDSSLLASLSEKERKSVVFFSGLFCYARAWLYIMKLQPQIVLSSLWKGAVLASWVKLTNRKVGYIHFIHSSKFFHFLDRYFTLLAVRMCDALFCDSYSAQDFIRPFANDKPIQVISFLHMAQTDGFVPKQVVLPKALFVGRFHPCKRIERIVTFIRVLKKHGIDFHVDLYGRDDGSMREVKAMIKKNDLEGNVQLRGEVPPETVERLFAHYDFYVQTSEVEGMAMSVVEAMQHGLVCLLTPVGEIRNYVEDGVNALLFGEPFEEHMEDMAKSLERLVSNPADYNQIAEAAFRTFERTEPFSVSLVQAIEKIQLQL